MTPSSTVKISKFLGVVTDPYTLGPLRLSLKFLHTEGVLICIALLITEMLIRGEVVCKMKKKNFVYGSCCP